MAGTEIDAEAPGAVVVVDDRAVERWRVGGSEGGVGGVGKCGFAAGDSVSTV